MDHVPVPKDPVWRPPRIPYYCVEEYDRGYFGSYPERQGWTETELFTRSTWTNMDSAGGRGRGATAAFLQQWLFFGLLRETFWNKLIFEDYIEEESGTKYVHTRNLLAHAHELIKTRNSGIFLEIHFSNLDRSLRTAHRTIGFICEQPVDALDPYFLLSLSLLGRFLTYLRIMLFPVNRNTSFLNQLVWSQPLIRVDAANMSMFENQANLLDHEMLQEGWCLRAVEILQGRGSLEYKYFASMLPNLQSGRRHRGLCTRTQCLASHVEKSSYRTVHASDGCLCPFQGFDQAAIETILEAGGLPLVAWDRNTEMVRLIPGKFDAPYVAISHVWSDGLGNPHENAMPQCQLEALNDLVQDVYSRKTEQIPFWIDTLCCPAKRSKGKQIAIRKMRDTYACADKVLVLDNVLRSIYVTGRSVVELASHICSSNWASRLWTFQEGALPKSLIFQFSNATLDSEDILSTAGAFDRSSDNWWGCSSDLRRIYYHIRGSRSYSEKPYRPPVMDLGYCATALITRTTSVQEDETLCLASLMAIDPAPLLSLTRQDRMAYFWSKFAHISEFWMYYPYPRLDIFGVRWAPKTLLGVGIAHPYDDGRASLTKKGLLVNAYSITLRSLNFPLSHPINSNTWIRGASPLSRIRLTEEPSWIRATSPPWSFRFTKDARSEEQGYSQFTIPDGHFSHIALLATKKIPDSGVFPSTNFVMVFVTEERDGVVYARRGDAGLIWKVDHPALQGTQLDEIHMNDKRFLLSQTSNRVAIEGDNYVVDNEYRAVLGDWAGETSKWCID